MPINFNFFKRRMSPAYCWTDETKKWFFARLERIKITFDVECEETQIYLDSQLLLDGQTLEVARKFLQTQLSAEDWKEQNKIIEQL